MRVLIQRVKNASVTVDGEVISLIHGGLLVFIGITEDDSREDILWLTKKIANIRLFDDENGVMNRSVIETGGDILAVSQFTLMASTKKGNRNFDTIVRGVLQRNGTCGKQTNTTRCFWSRHEGKPA